MCFFFVQWMEYLSHRFNGTLHNPDLSMDEVIDTHNDEEVEIVPMQVKSSRTIIREKYDKAKASGEVISLLGATTTRSSIQSTFNSISATVTAMRGSKRTEREVSIRENSAMISYEATRMVLSSDSSGVKIFNIAPGEAPNSRRIQLSMHPFAQGKSEDETD